jgi:hypothetical protein
MPDGNIGCVVVRTLAFIVIRRMLALIGLGPSPVSDDNRDACGGIPDRLPNDHQHQRPRDRGVPRARPRYGRSQT